MRPDSFVKPHHCRKCQDSKAKEYPGRNATFPWTESERKSNYSQNAPEKGTFKN